MLASDVHSMNVEPKLQEKIAKKRLLIGMAYLCLTAISPWLPAAENEPKSQVLRSEENLNPDQYSTKPPTKLKQAIEEYQSKRKSQETKPLKLNIKEALDALKDTDVYPGPGADTQSANNLTIADVRAKALENNLSIKVAQVDPMIAFTEVRGERAKFDKIIFAYAKYGQYDTPKISGDKVEFKSDNPELDGQQVKLSKIEQGKESLELDLGIKVPLRTGGTVTLSAPMENKVSEGKFESDEYRSALRFSFSQPLLRDAGVRVNEASIQIAEYSQQAVQLKTKLQSIRVITTVDKAYWDLYQAWGQLDIRRQQFEYANQNLAMVKNRVKEGLTAAIEINRAEIGVADRMEALIVAETNLKIAQRQLQFYMNEDVTSGAGKDPLVPVTQPYLIKYEFDKQQLVEDALAGRLELLEQELKLSADLIKIDYLENQTLPMFTLDYQYGALSNTNNSFGDNYRNVLNGDFRDWSIGLKFEMPLSNELRKSQLENAVLQRNQRLLTKHLQTLTVKKEIHDALDYVDQNWQRILAARQQVIIAGSNYEAELKQFNEGLRTMTEVLETLTRLGEAQMKEIKAITDYQIALVDIAYATGTLLGYSNMLMPETH
jgi:outer membrane protein